MKLKAFFSLPVIILTMHFNLLYSQEIPVINLAAAIEHPTKIVLSDFIENLTYIPLETNPDCLINGNPKVQLTKDYVIITTTQECLLFDRNGSFLRKIGQYGRGPGEFRNTSGTFDELSSTIYFNGWNGNFIKYSLDGKYIGSLSIPGYKDDLQNPSMPDRFTYLADNLLVCNYMNVTGLETKSIMIFNNKAEVLKEIPNRNILKKMNPTFRTGSVDFHHYNNSVFFQEYHNDTIFKISPKDIRPYFVIEKGKYKPPYESLWWPVEKNKQANLITQPRYFEGPRFITFNFNFIFTPIGFFALYDKTSKSIKVTEITTGIRNDIDNFIDLNFTSINKSGELSCLLQSQDLIKWFEKNNEQVKGLKAEFQKLKTISLGDNPVLVIAKYKQ